MLENLETKIYLLFFQRMFYINISLEKHREKKGWFILLFFLVQFNTEEQMNTIILPTAFKNRFSNKTTHV